MKTKVTYAEVKEALENGFISPLNSDVNISEINLITVEDAGRNNILAEIEGGTLVSLKDFISMFHLFKKDEENDFLTYKLNVMTKSGWFEVTMFNAIETKLCDDFKYILREIDFLKRTKKA